MIQRNILVPARSFGFMAVVAACAMCSLAAAAPAPADASAAHQKPNFVVILADDLGYNDVGCFGSALIKTPNIDKMAKEGVRFTNFYVGAPICTPSRAALLTGCIPVRVGFGDQLRQDGPRRSPGKVLHAGSPYGLDPSEVIIPEVLKPAGYYSGLVGKWHLGDAPEFNPIREGFDYFFGPPYSNDSVPFYFLRGTERLKTPPVMNELTTTYTQDAQRFITAHKDQPFFLYLAHNMPHVPLTPGKRFAGHSPRGLYGDAVEEVDWSVGEIIKTLKENHLEDHTLVIFASDNGPWMVKGEEGGSANPLRNGKTSSYEGGFRVPCVMWGPGIVKPGRVSDEIISTMDFMPTFAAMAGIDFHPAKPIDGKNQADLIEGKEGVHSAWKHFFYYFGNELHAVRENNYKLRAKNTLENENVYRKNCPVVSIPAALYDLNQDIGEQKSVMKDHPKIHKHLNQLLDQERQDLGDSLTSAPAVNERPLGHSDHPMVYGDEK